jgi:hypothetical protein
MPIVRSAVNAARVRVSSQLGGDAFVSSRGLEISVVPEIRRDPVRRGYGASQHGWRHSRRRAYSLICALLLWVHRYQPYHRHQLWIDAVFVGDFRACTLQELSPMLVEVRRKA